LLLIAVSTLWSGSNCVRHHSQKDLYITGKGKHTGYMFVC